MKKKLIIISLLLFTFNLNSAEEPCSQYKKYFPEVLKYNECMAKLIKEGK